MAAISSPGVGSGLDIAGLVSQLVAAEGQPALARLDRREAGLQARLSGLGAFNSALSTFNDTLSRLSNLSAFQSRSAKSSDSDVLSASAKADAPPGSYNVNITTLAAAHNLVTDQLNPFATTTEAVGTGTLTFRFGSDPTGSFAQNVDKGTHSVTIDGTNNSLEGIRDAINDADFGVHASIINNGSGYLLALTSDDTGADNAIEIVVDDTGDGLHTDANGLSRLAYNSSGAQLEQTAAATDAALTINGVNVTSSDNSISDAIEGVSLDLKEVGSSTVSVSQNRTLARTAVNDFVDSYNSLMSTVNGLTGYNPDTQVAGILNGDSGIRSLVSQIRRTIADEVDGLTGPYTNLSALGIATQNDGTLLLDDSKLNDALDNNFDDVAALFAPIGRISDSQISYASSTANTLAGNYAVNITQLATQGSITGNTTAALADDGAGNFTTPFVIDADNDTFKISVDGTTSDTITLSNKTYNTTAELVAEIQSRINADENLRAKGISVTVAFDAASDSISITSASYGSDSQLSFTSVDTNSAAQLGFDTALTGAGGLDVAGTIGGVAATGSGQFLTGTGDAEGLQLEISGGSLGARGTLDFSRGVADQLNKYISGLLDDGVFSDRIDTVRDGIDDIGAQRETLDRRLESIRARYLAQFTALDVLVNQLTNTSNFLSQQLASLPTISASRGSGS